jgi:hypothetical protein
MRLLTFLYNVLLATEHASRRLRREIEWRIILLNGFDPEQELKDYADSGDYDAEFPSPPSASEPKECPDCGIPLGQGLAHR